MRSELVERAQSGDREAFDALAAAIYDRLYAIGRRILRDGVFDRIPLTDYVVTCTYNGPQVTQAITVDGEGRPHIVFTKFADEGPDEGIELELWYAVGPGSGGG